MRLEAQIQQATKASIPRVAPLSLRSVSWWRVASCCWQSSRSLLECHPQPHWREKWLLRAALYGIPLPWIAVEAGWFVAEMAATVGYR
ncbi:cytochrome ubiquinol oxidase subunit I [Shigella flexneri]